MEDKLKKLKELFPTIDFHGNVFFTISKDDYRWIIRQLEKAEQLENLQKKTAENLVKCRVKLKKIKDVVES
jgi:hypothetical protein